MKRVLLADDSVTIQKVVELVLSGEGYEVVSVSDGQKAWQTVQEQKPDIVIADIEMPGIDGYTLCELIKKDEELKNIPVILLAGAFEPIDEEKLKTSGAEAYLIKPFEGRELSEKIHELTMKIKTEVVEEEPHPVPEEKIEEEEVLEPVVFEEQEEPPVSFEHPEEEPLHEEMIKPEEPEEAEEQPVEEILKKEEREEKPPQLDINTEEFRERIQQEIQRRIDEIMSDIPREKIEEKIQEQLNELVHTHTKDIDFEAILKDAFDKKLSEYIESTYTNQILPVIEKTIEDSVKRLNEFMRDQIEKAVTENVPRIAQEVIEKQVEEIKNSLWSSKN